MEFSPFKKTIAVSLATTCLMVGGALTANATPPLEESASITSAGTITEISPEIKDLYDPHVATDSSGKYIIKLDSTLSTEHKMNLQKILDATNSEYRQVVDELPSFSKATGHQIQAAGGGVTFHWWGKTLWLDNLNSYRLSALLTAGAGVAGIAALITAVTGVGGVVAGSIAAVLATLSGASLVCNWNMRGINIHLPNVGGVWCTSR